MDGAGGAAILFPKFLRKLRYIPRSTRCFISSTSRSPFQNCGGERSHLEGIYQQSFVSEISESSRKENWSYQQLILLLLKDRKNVLRIQHTEALRWYMIRIRANFTKIFSEKYNSRERQVPVLRDDDKSHE